MNIRVMVIHLLVAHCVSSLHSPLGVVIYNNTRIIHKDVGMAVQKTNKTSLWHYPTKAGIITMQKNMYPIPFSFCSILCRIELMESWGHLKLRVLQDVGMG